MGEYKGEEMNALKSRRQYDAEKIAEELEAKRKAEQEMLNSMSEEEREAYKKNKEQRLKTTLGLLSLASAITGDYSNI